MMKAVTRTFQQAGPWWWGLDGGLGEGHPQVVVLAQTVVVPVIAPARPPPLNPSGSAVIQQTLWKNLNPLTALPEL